ncbi:MAG TPA: 50S ribosomal protein L21 [Deltaproteobacteria bacterium]|nr:MAG: 50S ribosomal protein L21 [Deltaproteobacteria bacterium GWA2_45_12]HBF12335.1 50S ribosomal protein L21 [Deltaproteobacteria bacterium]
MQAVIQTGGKQYRVAKGNKILIEKLDGDKGQSITFDQVLLIEGDSVKVGTPLVSGAKVLATVVDQTKGEKVIAYKYKRRKGYHKKKGHRQSLTCVEIKEIHAS